MIPADDYIAVLGAVFSAIAVALPITVGAVYLLDRLRGLRK